MTFENESSTIRVLNPPDRGSRPTTFFAHEINTSPESFDKRQCCRGARNNCPEPAQAHASVVIHKCHSSRQGQEFDTSIAKSAHRSVFGI